MTEPLRSVFFGEKASTFSLLHYAVLEARAEVLLWVASKPAENSLPARQRFVSFTDWRERLQTRARLELEALRLLKRPLSGIETRTPIYPTSRGDIELETRLRELRPDLILSAGYSRLIAPRILEIPRLGAFNCHPSPLPAFAGSNPWFWMLRNGERRAAVTIHRMVAEADAGNIVCQKTFPIPPAANHQQLYNATSVKSAALLRDCLIKWQYGEIEEAPQDLAHRSFFPSPTDKDYRIDWAESAEQICNLIRAASPAPGAWSVIHGKRFVVRRARRIKMSGAPGVILHSDHSGVAIGSGDQALLLETALVEGREVRGMQIVRLLAISNGSMCEST